MAAVATMAVDPVTAAVLEAVVGQEAAADRAVDLGMAADPAVDLEAEADPVAADSDPRSDQGPCHRRRRRRSIRPVAR